MQSTFLLLRPFAQGLRNRIAEIRWTPTIVFRSVVLVSFLLSLPVLLYHAMRWVLLKANEDPALSILPPGLLVGLILGFLMIMLVIPAIFLVLGSFFLAEDLELLLAAPIRSSSFFFGRFIGVVVGSSWMPLLFIFPVLYALWETTSSSWLFFPQSLLLLIPFFVIPSALSLFIALVMTYLMPIHRAKFVSYGLFLASLFAVYLVVDGLDIQWKSLSGSKQMVRLIKFFEVGQRPWMPSTWASQGIEKLLETKTLPWQHLRLLWSVCIAILSAAYIAFLSLHLKAYSRARVRSRSSGIGFGLAGSLFSKFGAFLPAYQRALITKETRMIARDVGQVVQVVILCALGLLYIYNIRIFSVLDSMPKSMASWWRTFLFMGNLCMGAFLTTSICTRLVFPSVSLEGRSLWLLQVSPLSLSQLLRAKLIGWLIPVSILSCAFFTAGAAAIGGYPSTIVISGILSLILCYGIVGLAIGLGAVFARFDWEHPSQLAASFGSMVFMLSSISLVFLNMLPAWLLLARDQTYETGGMALYQQVVLLVICTLVLNFTIVRSVLRSGEQRLARLGK